MQSLLAKYADRPKQGTDEWKRSRLNTIGGSECNNFYGDKSLVELARSKLGHSTFSGNIHTRWGNVMEQIGKNFTEFAFNTEVFEVGGIDGLTDTDGKVLIKYSPDGLLTLPKLDAEMINNMTVFFNTNTLSLQEGDDVLMEYKSPSVRMPNDVIPRQYIPQLLAGLNAVPLCKYAIFDDSSYRVIDIDEFMSSCNMTTWYAVYSLEPYRVDGKLFIDVMISPSKIDFYNTACLGCRTTPKLEIYFTKRFYNTDAFKPGSDKHKVLKHLKEARRDLGPQVHIIGFVFVETIKKSLVQFYKTEDFPERAQSKIRRFIDVVDGLRSSDDFMAAYCISDKMFD